jgi:hypothetical protein
MNPIKEFFMKRDGVYAVQLFANDKLNLDEFDNNHLISRMDISGLWKWKPILFRADPFMFVKNEELFLFYEIQYGFDCGKIAMTKTCDLVNWSEPVVVLQETFHLSFPFVFEEDHQIYMIPESQESDTIKLYRANDDLTSFSFVRVLLRQERVNGLQCNYVDSHVYKKDGLFYLFTSFMKDWKTTQELYVSDSLLEGVFKKHPSSPLCISHEYGRNGGSLIEYDDKLLRVSQDCHKNYGENVSLHQIVKFDNQCYQEQLYKRNIFSDNLLFPDGGHQLNIVQFLGKYIYATDYKENRWTWYHLYHSCLVKLHLAKKR